MAAWLVWHSMRISLLSDLDAPAATRPGSRPRGGLTAPSGALGAPAAGVEHSYTQSAMPTYEYRCDNGHTFEVMQRMSDDPLTECTVCGAPVQRVFHPVAVHFKGSGFYTTDYGSKKRTGRRQRQRLVVL